MKLAEIWAEVLELDETGICDNFFELGGHSLAANRVVSRVFGQYQLEIPLQSLFQSPTIAAMATVITAHQGTKLDESHLATILDELASLSDAEAERLVSTVVTGQSVSDSSLRAFPLDTNARASFRVLKVA